MSNPKARQVDLGANPSRDIIIPVIGSVGSGKSTFINLILGDRRMAVNDNLDSCTSNISVAQVQPSMLTHFPWLENRRVLLADTPGLDDAERSDENTVRMIKQWLKDSRRKSVVGGAIYLIDASVPRFTETDRRNIQIFTNSLSGPDMLENTIIGLTKTSRMASNDPQERVPNLRTNKLGNLIEKNLHLYYIADAASSGQAWKIFNAILSGYFSQKFEEVSLDIVIPILGVTGSGRSTFINSILGEAKMEVGHDMESCTVQPIIVEVDSSKFPFKFLRSHRLLLVNTPGFDNEYISDRDILQHIISYVKDTCQDKFILGGAIYLQDISLSRSPDVAKCFELLERLSGLDVLKHIVLGATKWDRLDPEEARCRLERLKCTQWKGMLLRGAQAFGIEQYQESTAEERYHQNRRLLNALLERLDESGGKENSFSKHGVEGQITMNIWTIILRAVASVLH